MSNNGVLLTINVDHPTLNQRERDGLDLVLSMHRIYADQGRMRESYTAAQCAMRLWHMWTRNAPPPQPYSGAVTVPVPLKESK